MVGPVLGEVVGHCSSTYSSQSRLRPDSDPHTMFPESAPHGPRHILSQTDSPAIHSERARVLLLPFVARHRPLLVSSPPSPMDETHTQIHLSIRSPLCTQTTITVPSCRKLASYGTTFSRPHPILENYSLMCLKMSTIFIVVHCLLVGHLMDRHLPT